jgi:allantoinase
MDDYSDDLPFWNDPAAKDIVIMPYALDSNDMKMWTDPAMTPAQWLDYAVDSFDWLYAEGEAGDPKMMSFGVHLRIIGRPGRIGYFAKFLDYVATKPDVWIATRREIADCFRAQSN